MTTNPQAQAAGHAASAQRCPLCGENEPFTGTCGGGRDNPRALCYQGAAQAAAPAVGVNLRNAYARDLEDTLNQIADALGVERGKPEALITAALAASTPSPQPAQPAQAEDAALLDWMAQVDRRSLLQPRPDQRCSRPRVHSGRHFRHLQRPARSHSSRSPGAAARG